MGVPHPIPYQGSKRGLANIIVAYLPKKMGDNGAKIIEPFAGSAAVSLAAACSGSARGFLINDANIPLIALWKSIIEQPQLIAEQYRSLWEEQRGREREYYYLVRDEFNKTQQPHHFLYLLARCVKASVRYNTRGEFNQSPDNRRCGTQPSTMQQNIIGASYLLRGCSLLMHGDYRVALADAGTQDVIYMDPPYQGVCGKRNPRYSNHLVFDEFVETLLWLNQRGLSYIVSYDGRTGGNSYGIALPPSLGLKHLEVKAGRSSQATLLGRDDQTYESLYLSQALMARLEVWGEKMPQQQKVIPSLFSIDYAETTSTISR